MMKKTISTILLLAMLCALCACGTKSQFAGSGYTEPGVSTGNAANTSDNIQSPASGASDSDNMDSNEENEENSNVSFPKKMSFTAMNSRKRPWPLLLICARIKWMSLHGL